ncbi:MAG: ketopantoate reductase family protein, partial [Pontibacterium sp.]
KAYDTAGALDNVKAALHPRAGVVILQNGMGAQQQAAEQITPVPVWAGSTTDGAWLKAPFHVVFAGQGETRLGLLGSDSNPALPPGLSPSAELTLLADHNIELSLWQKLAINCAINPLTAWYDCPNGELAEHRHKHEHMARLCEEIEQLALAKGLLLFPEGVFKRAKQVALATRTNLSSMLQDVRHGRPTELNYITGYLLGEAHKLNMTLPANQQLFTHIRQGLKHNDLYSTD